MEFDAYVDELLLQAELSWEDPGSDDLDDILSDALDDQTTEVGPEGEHPKLTRTLPIFR